MLKDIYLILEKPTEHKLGKTFSFLIFSFVIISTISLYLSTDKSLNEYKDTFSLIEDVTMIFFTIELFLRLISMSQDPKYRGFSGKVKFFIRPFIIIDILVLVPYYLMFLGIDLVFLRVLRVLRIFKLFRDTKYGDFDDTLIEILEENQNKFIIVFIISLILVSVTAPIMYYIENGAQPEVFSSIPAALWWTTVTFTTVGYGDMFPITALGKILATIVSVLGIAFYAIPGAIFTSALLSKLNKKEFKTNKKDKN
jgi:voltage-gated potassium channel